MASKAAAPSFGVTQLGRAEIAYQVDQAKRWGTFSRRRDMDAMPDARVLAIEWRRAGRIMRDLLAKGGRPEVESQSVTHYTRVMTALGLARAIDAGADYQPARITADTYVCSGWACTDCLVLLANGENPPWDSDAEIAAWHDEIDRRNAGYNVTPGMPREQHACPEDTEECECETDSFSWCDCDVCGGNLGGERHAVSFFQINE